MTIQTWTERDDEYAAFREALQAIAPGSRVLAIHDNGNSAIDPIQSVRWYMAAPFFPAVAQTLAWRNIDTLAVIERQAYSPTLFKNPSAQPLRATAIHRDIDPIVPAPWITAAHLRAGADLEAEVQLRDHAAEAGRVAFWAGWPQRFDYVVVIRYPNVEPTRIDDLPLLPLTSVSSFDIYRVTASR